MQKKKQKTPLEKFLRGVPKKTKHVPRQLIVPIAIVVLSLAVLAGATVRSLSPGKACVDAPVSAYPSMDVIVQKGSDRTEKTVTNRHIISCMSDDLKYLPELPSEGVICPATDGSTYIISFDGGRIVTGSLSGCQAVKIQDDAKTYYLLPDTSYAKDFRTKLQRIIR